MPSKDFYKHAQDATYNRLKSLFNLTDRTAVYNKFDQEYGEILDKKMDESPWHARISDCIKHSDLDDVINDDDMRDINAHMRDMMLNLIVGFNIRSEGFLFENQQQSDSADVKKRPQSMFHMGGSGRHITDVHVNHIVNEGLCVLVDDYNLTPRSALSMTGYAIGTVCNVVQMKSASMRRCANVEPQRGASRSDDMAAKELDFHKNYWQIMRDKIGYEYKIRRNYMQSEAQIGSDYLQERAI